MPPTERKIKVCLPFIGDSIGGSYHSAIALINALQKKNDVEVVVVLHLEESPLVDHLNQIGMKFILLPVKNFPGETASLFDITSKLFQSGFALANFLKKHEIDIVHTNDLRTNLAWSFACSWPLKSMFGTKDAFSRNLPFGI